MCDVNNAEVFESERNINIIFRQKLNKNNEINSIENINQGNFNLIKNNLIIGEKNK